MVTLTATLHQFWGVKSYIQLKFTYHAEQNA